MPRGLNIVLQRLESAAEHEPFDLILATNVLICYDVFDQLLASANIAKMLRSGSFFLSNDRIFELPDSSIQSVGDTEVTYMTLPGIGRAGDRIVWYRDTDVVRCCFRG
jgi:hypothetical protein